MGCSQSSNTMQPKKIEKIQPVNISSPITKKKNQQKLFFLFGHITEEEYIFAKVSVTNRSINRLTIPEGFKPFNFSSMIELQNKEFFISGGINFALTIISEQAFIYSSSLHSIKKVANMKQPRYTHASIVHNKYLYVIGGRFFGEDQQAILHSCEKYSFANNQWIALPNLNIKRCTCYIVQWKKSLLVFGGYTGTFERSQKIQRLNQAGNKWEIVDFSLNRGIQSAFVLPTKPNQITIFGGNTNSGPTASVSTINLKEKTIISHKSLKQEKTLHKTFVFEQQMFIFGGSDKLLLQIYSLNRQNSQTVDLKLNQQFTPQVFQVLTMSESSLKLEYSDAAQQKPIANEADEIILIFGTSQQPFILQINVSIPSCQKYPVPLSLKLFANSGGIHLDHLRYIIFGGIEDESLSFISSNAFLYNHLTKDVHSLASMLTPRYSFSYQRIQNRIYAIGGGNSDVDGNLEILDDCQYYSIDQNVWKSICNLPCQLISSMSLAYNGFLYVFGGVRSSKARNKSIYKYNHIEDSWSQLNFHFPFGIEAAAIYQYKPSQFYIFGGRIDNGDSDGIWHLIFAQGSSSQCSFYQKGKIIEKKSGLKVFRPMKQDFFVAFGGKKQIVNCYDSETFKPMQWDGLRHLKDMFSQQIINLNSPSMEIYLATYKQYD